MDQVSADEAGKIPISDLMRKLASGKDGLTEAEAESRLEVFGGNEIIEKKASPILKFLGYLWGPIPWMIEIAAILSIALSHFTDFFVIVALLALNAFVGFFEERQAENAIELLKKRLALSARILRDGAWRELPARELVPGDVIRVRLGDIVPADLKLIAGEYLLADESALTGESLPVGKHLSDVAYSGSVVRRGEMNALVVATGMCTYFGKTAGLVEQAKPQGHFQRAVVNIGDYLIALNFAIVAVVFLLSLFRHESLLIILQFVLVLTVAAIPVALPAVLSVTMAAGATALAAKEAIVNKLVAIEEAAGVDVLCADKTGTITRNELSIAALEPLDEFTQDDLLIFGALASRKEDKDPIDMAILAGIETARNAGAAAGGYRVSDFIPFDPTLKRTEATVRDAQGNRYRVAKGAPQVILSLAANKEEIGGIVGERTAAMAAKGYRALGVTRTDSRGDWRYVGLVALYDPPRDDSAETIETARHMGLDVKMITGDHIAIAKETARRTGLGTNTAQPSSFADKPDAESQRVVEEADGFAEVFPEHKYRIIELLQGEGHIVGMTGDGVNDAPALKKADVGIAVSGATDAAKSAAAIVLTRPGLSVIIDAVKESRKTFERMNNYAVFRIAVTIWVLFFIALSIIVFQFFPVTARMIVLLALLSDFPMITIAVDNVTYSGKPVRWDMRTLLKISTVLGGVSVASTFGILYMGIEYFKLAQPVLQSFIYLTLSVGWSLLAFVSRTREFFWSVKPAFVLFLAVALAQLVATVLAVFGILMAPIGVELALFIWGYALAVFVLTDFIKVGAYKLLQPHDL